MIRFNHRAGAVRKSRRDTEGPGMSMTIVVLQRAGGWIHRTTAPVAPEGALA
jgi:hypothetical protein